MNQNSAMKELIDILTHDEYGRKYTAKDYAIGLCIAIVFTLLTCIQ